MLSKVIMVAICTTLTLIANAQDPLFSQFYHSPLYLNPAFSGCAKNDFRLCMASRLQWLNLPSPLQYHSVSVDKYLYKPRASLGFMANRFTEGYLKTNHLSLIGSKSLGATEEYCAEWFFNFAMQFTYAWKNVDKRRLLFPDQIDQNGPTGLASEVELSQYAKRDYFDVTAAFIFTYKSWMIGGSWHHLTQPHNGLIGSTDVSRLPHRITCHLSYIYDPAYGAYDDGPIVVKPTAIVNLQGVSRSLTIGSLFDLRDERVELGLWYKNNMGGISNHTLSVGVNIKLGNKKNDYNREPDNRYRIGMSYDAELNSPGVKNTSGSTEIGILFEKNLKNDSDCPKPYRDCEKSFPWVFH